MKSHIGALYLNQNNLKIRTIVALILRQVFSLVRTYLKGTKIRVWTSGSSFTTKAKDLASFQKGANPYTSASIIKRIVQTEIVLKFLQLLVLNGN